MGKQTAARLLMVISFFEMFLAAGYTVMSVVRRIDPTMLRFLNFTLLNSSEPIDHAALTSVEGWIGISDGVVMFLVALVGFLGTMRENVFLLLIVSAQRPLLLPHLY
mmetsp:Transcript_527/g.1094  ORF Transcript_527/g.1094 Transcript_527/m.1094 type:complete len:107 (-) Transcript_527:93-413(-)